MFRQGRFEAGNQLRLVFRIHMQHVDWADPAETGNQLGIARHVGRVSGIVDQKKGFLPGQPGITKHRVEQTSQCLGPIAGQHAGHRLLLPRQALRPPRVDPNTELIGGSHQSGLPDKTEHP